MRRHRFWIVIAGALACAWISTQSLRLPSVEAQAPVANDRLPGRTPPSLGDLLENATRIDGTQIQASITILSQAPESGGEGRSEIGMPPMSNVVIDAWTSLPAAPILFESYGFPFPAPGIAYNLLVKTGIAGAPLMMEDLFVFPCGTTAIPPVPVPVIFLDDVVVGPLPPLALVVATVVFPPPPPGMTYDWFAVVDFDGTTCPPGGCGIELGPLTLVKAFTPMSTDIDEVGAEVFNLFVPGPPAIDVYEPNPAFPIMMIFPKAVPAGIFGEHGETRPWCFAVF